MSDLVEIDATGAIRTFHTAGINISKAMPKLVARLVFKGEEFMKDPNVTPYKTGRLRGGIHGHPTIYPISLAANVTYVWAANIHSRKPRFIERTHEFIIRTFPAESKIIVANALKGMDK